MSHIVIIGGGVIGLTAAWELSRHGARVTVLDQSDIGREASWAGAGMIPPGDLEDDSELHPLAAMSASLWPGLSEQLRDETGIDNGYRRCGAVRFDPAARLEPREELLEWKRLGVPVEWLDGAGIAAREPAISLAILKDALFLPTFAQVRNPRHLRALRTACEQRGVALHPGTPLLAWRTAADRIVAAITPQQEFPADQFLVSAGAWTEGLVSHLGIRSYVTPVRGQIVLLRTPEPILKSVLDCGMHYLVPRDDGRLLVGATSEFEGFEKETTDEATAKLLKFAHTVVPALKSAELERTWAGLRPHSALGRPSIGPAPGWPNLFVATGHFRAGLSNSPASGQMIRELMLGETPTLDPEPFEVLGG